MMSCELRTLYKEVPLAYFVTQLWADYLRRCTPTQKIMVALCPYEMLVSLDQTARCHVSDDSSLYFNQRENEGSSLRIGRLIPQVFKFVPQ